ncbi:hypothetical protein A2348_03515 [Candidatus Uhrbacteria bacterium RIFOXYB12_FULL_58_10]|uniref:DUF3179 domain-containing protein n=1 Tax=Candidatus Uhrbacteria bacterium RIFOXYB2_FULL_57_15 TaxID=1802422 RepID=A0A1F7WB44_9BACT|nr:MAG: hypothetical protein A2348_03515 [Candidatus Uhrbacteria bacterium RIFOXYB12_FULL_58_10]OGL99314.1 MAG: hypothetical protein A2304_05215 [Candidatus Uhrbacteria bacterium RIFOXYB2_FULL_57_15]
MKRTTFYWTWIILISCVAGLCYAMYWFYRIPPAIEPMEGSAFAESWSGNGSILTVYTPAFESVAAADQYLNDNGLGLDVEINGKHRFYPYQILVWHEVINDLFDDVPVLVTYSPLSDTGMAFERTVDGEEMVFSVSGSLWNNISIFVDATSGSRWIQLYGRAADGEFVGKELRPIMAKTISWSDWKAAYPHGDVLTRDTGATRDYTRNPYGNYAATPAVWYPLTSVDARLDAKTVVYAVSVGNLRAAYPADVITSIGEARETVGGVPIEVTFDEALGTVRAYRLELDGNAGDELVVTRGFWFAFAAAYPGIHLYELP